MRIPLLFDYQVHLLDEAQPRTVNKVALQALLAAGTHLRPPVRGTVYATLLNDQDSVAALGDATQQPPYQAPPKAPILYIKPGNTFRGHGSAVSVPDTVPALLIGASLGLVIGQTACRVTAQAADQYIAGYTIVADLCVPHDQFFRPAVRANARDGFCVMGPAVVARALVADPDGLEMAIRVDGTPVFHGSTARCVRNVAQLLCDVSEFMTLNPGDVLTLGVPHAVPLAHPGQAIEIDMAGLPTLAFGLVGESGPRRAS